MEDFLKPKEEMDTIKRVLSTHAKVLEEIKTTHQNELTKRDIARQNEIWKTQHRKR